MFKFKAGILGRLGSVRSANPFAVWTVVIIVKRRTNREGTEWLEGVRTPGSSCDIPDFVIDCA